MINFLINVLKLVTKCIFRIEIIGADNIPKDGSCMVCANHISIWDPIILICYLPRWICFIAKKETEKIPVIGWILKKIGCIFINRDGVDLSAMRQSLKVLSAENVLGIFPTGTREKKTSRCQTKIRLCTFGSQIRNKGCSDWHQRYIQTIFKNSCKCWQACGFF
jgi:1-acyl-sn-glycerol-3-phosphate acyltransferase